MDINTPYISDPQMLDSILSDLHGEMEYPITNDFLSKYALQKDLYALKGLLAALLYIDIDEITDIYVTNPIEPSDCITGKDCILDIKLELNHSKLINIEIQSIHQDFWPERSITYLCRLFNHLKEGDSYSDIKPCVHIGIMNHALFNKNDARYTDEFYSEYRLLNTKSHQEYSSKFEIKVLSLSQLENASEADKKNSNGLYYWAKLFKAKTWSDFMDTATNNPMMKSFVGTVRTLTADEKVAEACERRRRYLNDIATYEDYIAKRDAVIAEQDAKIAENNATLAEKDASIAEKDAILAEKDAIIEELKKQLASLNNK